MLLNYGVGEDNGNPLQYSCLENPRDRGAWWAAVYGVSQSRTWLKWLSSSSSSFLYLYSTHRLKQNFSDSTKWSQAKANRNLPTEHSGHSKHPHPTKQEITLHVDINRWSIPKSELYSLQPKMEKLYTVSKNKTGSWLWLRSWTPYC